MGISSNINLENGKILLSIIDSETTSDVVNITVKINSEAIFNFDAPLNSDQEEEQEAISLDLISILNRFKDTATSSNQLLDFELYLTETDQPVDGSKLNFLPSEIEEFLLETQPAVSFKTTSLNSDKVIGYFTYNQTLPSDNVVQLDVFFNSKKIASNESHSNPIINNRYDFELNLADLNCSDVEQLSKQILILEKFSYAISPKIKVALSHIQLDMFIGKNALGWAVSQGNGDQEIAVVIGQLTIGTFTTSIKREDVATKHDLECNTLGFMHDLGGVLQFGAMNEKNIDFKLQLVNQPDIKTPLKISIKESTTFPPSNLLLKARKDNFPFTITQAHLKSKNQFELYFKGEGMPKKSRYHVVGIQIDKLCTPHQVMSALVDSQQHIFGLKGKLLSCNSPVLIAITHFETGRIVYTDCIPNPSLFHDNLDLIIQLHGLFINSENPLSVLQKIQQQWFMYKTLNTDDCNEGKPIYPSQANTDLILFARPLISQIDTGSINNLKDSLQTNESHVLNFSNLKQADPQSKKQNLIALMQKLEESKSEFFLFAELGVTVRPDYWAIIKEYWESCSNQSAIIGNYILYDGVSKPRYINHKPLTLPTIKNHVPISLALFKREIFLNLLSYFLFEEKGDIETSEIIYPEHIIAHLKNDDILHIKLPLSITKEPPYIQGELRYGLIQEEAYPSLINQNLSYVLSNNSIIEKTNAHQLPKISVIISFRNNIDAANRAISSLKLQNYNEGIELLLISSSSHPSYTNAVYMHAMQLFGKESLKLIEYSEPSNYSKIFNIGASQATHPLLFILSPEVELISKNVLTNTAKVMENESVASCGLRILKLNTNNSYSVDSVGFRLNIGTLASLGGRILGKNRPHLSHLTYAMRVAANSFSAVMLKKELFLDLGGLDQVNFSVDNYDIDFCLRASNNGYTHICLGNTVARTHHLNNIDEAQHIDTSHHKILESIINLDMISQSYTSYNFGDISTF